MKVSLLISGYLRSLKLNLNSIQTHILSKFDKVDVYIHITSDDNDKYLNVVSDEIINALNPICVIREPNANYNADVQTNSVYNLWRKYYKLNILRQENEYLRGRSDVVIKYRPDCHIEELNFNPDMKPGIVYLPEESVIDVDKLRRSDDPYICDILAYGDSEAMNRYFDIAWNLPRLFEEYGNISETLLYHHLDGRYVKEPIKYKMILSSCNVFAICGDSSSGKTTLAEALKQHFNSSFILECDRYHKWERNDPNWNNTSHLNVEANHLTKMRQDVFDLKIGKDIYQIDYDHTIGKFTDIKTEKPADNILVCGLHSLYNDKNIYNLKIFMDTHEDLRKEWKYKRDTESRGYTREQVEQQILARQKDYIEHILPQKDLADIIVEFNPTQDGVYLSLRVSNLRHYTELYEAFSKAEIEFSITAEQQDFIFIFHKYKPAKLVPPLKFARNDYYDYIVYAILTLGEVV